MKTIKKIFPILMVNIFFIVIIFTFHYYFPSLLNSYKGSPFHPTQLSDDLMSRVWYKHTVHPAFAARPLTSFLIKIIHENTSLNYSWSFVVINFSLLFICGTLLYALARAYTLSKIESLISVILFYSSFTIFFSFFSSIDTYDEPLQYTFLLLTFLLIKKKKVFLASITFFFALLARETSILLLPIYIILLSPAPTITPYIKNLISKKTFLFLLSILLYAGVLFFILNEKNLLTDSIQYVETKRLAHLNFNFQNERFATESIISIFLTLAIPFFIVTQKVKNSKLTTEEKILTSGFFIINSFNILLVLTTARAREARLFALPLLIVWPMLGKYLLHFLKQFKFDHYFSLFKKNFLLSISYICCLFINIIIGTLIAYKIYIPTYSGNFSYGFKVYFLFTWTILNCLYYLKTIKYSQKNFEYESFP